VAISGFNSVKIFREKDNLCYPLVNGSKQFVKDTVGKGFSSVNQKVKLFAGRSV
jgi:hypothetical protein